LHSALAVDRFREELPEDTRSFYAKSRYAMALELGGCVKGDHAMLDEAITRLDELVDCGDWTQSGKAQIYRQRGDVYRYKAAWREAKESFEKAVSIEQEAIFDVYIAQSTLYVDGAEQATLKIRSVDASRLNPSEYLDYVFILAQIAVESGDKELLKLAESLLRNLRIAEPYYQQECASLLLSVIDTNQSGPSEEKTQGVRRQTRGMLTLLLRYIKLEPNVMGIGVNLGRVIEDLASRDAR
jgi:tetratricopeptide (TPR) repeat protein